MINELTKKVMNSGKQNIKEQQEKLPLIKCRRFAQNNIEYHNPSNILELLVKVCKNY